MGVIEDRVDAMLRSPTGCAFLILANASGLSAEEITRPENSLYIAGFAANQVEVWRSDYIEARDHALRRGPQYRELGIEILNEPGAADWFGPLDPRNQLFAYQIREPEPVSPERYFPPSTPLETSRYGEQLNKSFFTSTRYGEYAHIVVARDEHVCDYYEGERGSEYPVWSVTASPESRVYEITSTESWHRLAASYPTAGVSRDNVPPFIAEAGRITPDWAAVSQDWDAVHLTFGGLLCADQVMAKSSAGWTFFWSWNIEQTLWLRWMFDEVVQLPDHTPTRSHNDLQHPFYLNGKWSSVDHP